MKPAAFIAAALILVGVAAALPRLAAKPAGVSPLRQVDVFFDGVNNADYRETCSVWQAGRHHMRECENWLVLLAAQSGVGGYRVVPHSTREWREGNVRVASVKVDGPYGAVLAARVVETRKRGWLVVAVVG